jgi:hypothetical protein
MMYPIDPRHETILKRFSKTEIERFKTDGVAFDEVLCKAAKQCSDVLFLVKLHPGNSMGLSGAGVEALSKLDNVQVVTSEWSVLDCIGAADLWLVYESTTALEAWLLGVPTALVNPSGIDFTRDKVAEGSPNLPTSVDIVDAISSLQGEQPMTAFDDLAPIRDRLIKATIQWADGLNHVRAGNAILDLLEADATPPRSTSWDLRKALWKYKLLTWAKPLLRRSKAWSQYYKHVDGWDQGRLDSYATETMQRQQAYYAQQGLTLTDLKSIQCL